MQHCSYLGCPLVYAFSVGTSYAVVEFEMLIALLCDQIDFRVHSKGYKS